LTDLLYYNGLMIFSTTNIYKNTNIIISWCRSFSRYFFSHCLQFSQLFFTNRSKLLWIALIRQLLGSRNNVVIEILHFKQKVLPDSHW